MQKQDKINLYVIYKLNTPHTIKYKIKNKHSPFSHSHAPFHSLFAVPFMLVFPCHTRTHTLALLCPALDD